ncbi:M20/M25/M40 family metallo-hydrolase [Corynebacterium hadale]|uniref:M20/M25/M40 family metallo-hydrolase n=1 Tax=Corynebacterium hadale TaxID=2026255 RepID=UPI000BAA5DB3|nr:M20/M25/M40 family metallo-hydrolase [Corynebacterium hadale]MCG7254274.1 M20/M25/M40 family metallo-hydrolase [Corynebacterium hadale]MCG7257043.1 M20/M25/M40 family metallo-hydrolase [Corynebacterium hadale]MCG7265791.1 M20/M25/M40 family metallo-hydrolase [Corynebacterium hadale]PAT07483.1 acetylornithine deacetylase [Corynebacterium hadale]
MTLADTTITLLKELVQISCVNDLTPDSGQESKAADVLERFFADAPNVRVERFEPHPGRTSIAFTIEGSDPSAEPLTLLGHTDVVPVDEAKWTKDPFGAQIIDGHLYGRGATDMLYITAAMAATVRDVALSGTQPTGTLTFVGCADEEARGGLGVGWLAEHAPDAFSWKNCLSEEGGSHLPVQDGSDAVVVVIGEKGAAQRRLTVHGDAGHGSTPHGRELTIAKIGKVAERIAALTPEVSSEEPWPGYVRAWKFDPETEQALLRGEGYEAFGELQRYSHAMSHLTVAPTVLRAGGAINVLPSEASIELDIRQLPGQSQEDIDDLLREALGDLAAEVEITHLITEDATVSPTEGPLYDAIVDTFAEFFPEAAVVPTLAAGGSDLRFARRKGGVGYGFAMHKRENTLGKVLDLLHSHDEYVDLTDVELTTQAYRSLIRRMVNA